MFFLQSVDIYLCLYLLSVVITLSKYNMIRHSILPNISVDCVIFGFDFEKLNILLVERKLIDEKTSIELINDLTLVGYHIFNDENLDNAATRILKDTTGLENIYLEQFHTFGDLNRVTNPIDQLWINSIGEEFNDRIITVGYFSLIDNTKVTLVNTNRNIDWYPVYQLNKLTLAFDHRQIINKALEALRKKMRLEPIAFKLLPEKFTLTQLQKLYEEVMRIKLDKRNFRKKIAQMPYVVPLIEKQKGVAHKPAQLFKFSKKVFEKNKPRLIDSSINLP